MTLTSPTHRGRKEAPAPVNRRAFSPSRRIVGSRWFILLGVMLVLVAWPLVVLEGRVLLEPSKLLEALEVPGVVQALINTVLLSAGSTVIAVVLGVLLAWCTTRVPPRAARFVSMLPVLPLVVPAVASIIGWTYLLAPRTGLINVLLRETGLFKGTTGPVDVFTLPPIIILTALSLTSFVYLFVRSALQQRGIELEVAAEASGATPMRIFWTVTIPLLRPSITFSTGIVFLLGLGQFTAPLILGAKNNIEVITTILYRLSQDYPIDYSLGAALSLPLVLGGIVVIWLQRVSLRDEVKYRSVSGKSRLAHARVSWLAVIPLALYAAITVVLPVGTLIIVSLSPYWSGKFAPETFTLNGWAKVLSDSNVQEAIRTTSIAIGAATIIVIPLGYFLSVAMLRRTKMPASIKFAIDFLTNIPLALPGAMFALALLFTYSGPPFNLYGTWAMLVLAFVILMIPFSMRPQLSAMLQNGDEYEEASRTSGAGPLRTGFSINVPLVRHGIGVAAAFVIILLLHEFTAAVLIATTKTNVLATLLYARWTSGTTSEVSVISLLIVFVTMIALGITTAITGWKSLRTNF